MIHAATGTPFTQSTQPQMLPGRVNCVDRVNCDDIAFTDEEVA